GRFASVDVIRGAEIQSGPADHADTAGHAADAPIDDNDELIPRKLTDDLALRIVVVEAPATQLRAEVGIEADPTRLDAYAGTRMTFRNLFGPQHHVVLEGNVGYGWLVSDDQDPAQGVYGSARAQD